jgi:SulP family sulfate permease
MAIATAMQRKTGLGARVGAGRELVALGMSNLVVSLFRGYPVTGSFSRTSVNAACGAKTKLSAVVSSLICAAVLVCLTPALFYLPKFALSAIVLQSVLNLVDVPEAVFLWNTSKREFAAFCTVLVASLTLGFEAGLAGGIVVSWMGAVLHVTLPKVSLLRLLPPGLSSSSAAPAAAAFVDAPSSGAGAADVMLLKLSGNVWFSTSEAVEQALEVARDLFQPSAVVLVLDEAAQVDASGIAALSNMADSVFKSSGLALLVTGLGASTTRALERAREANLHLAETWNFAPLVMGIAADKPPSLLGFRDVDAALEYCADKCKPRSEAAFFGEAAAGLLDDARLRAWRADDGSPETAPNVCRLPSFARGAAGLPFEVVLADQRFVPV